MHEPFAEFAALLLICALTGALFVRLRQPVLIAYIVVGVLVGPAVFGLVTAHDQIDLLAQVGVAVLLFAVGLKLDLHHIRHIGPVALATGLGQLSFTIVIGFAIVMALGREWLEALYIAVALTFSSTIIIVKLLSDKRELESLHGRIAVGFLIVQDLAVVIAMMVMSGLGRHRRRGGQRQHTGPEPADPPGGRCAVALPADALCLAARGRHIGTLAGTAAGQRHQARAGPGAFGCAGGALNLEPPKNMAFRHLS
jgi:predicted Kef-type K+ transport protein